MLKFLGRRWNGAGPVGSSTVEAPNADRTVNTSALRRTGELHMVRSAVPDWYCWSKTSYPRSSRVSMIEEKIKVRGFSLLLFTPPIDGLSNKEWDMGREGRQVVKLRDSRVKRNESCCLVVPSIWSLPSENESLNLQLKQDNAYSASFAIGIMHGLRWMSMHALIRSE